MRSRFSRSRILPRTSRAMVWRFYHRVYGGAANGDYHCVIARHPNTAGEAALIMAVVNARSDFPPSRTPHDDIFRQRAMIRTRHVTEQPYSCGISRTLSSGICLVPVTAEHFRGEGGFEFGSNILGGAGETQTTCGACAWPPSTLSPRPHCGSSLILFHEIILTSGLVTGSTILVYLSSPTTHRTKYIWSCSLLVQRREYWSLLYFARKVASLILPNHQN
ncbi:hypothetical protein DFH09DRAFT_503484 [Mycena vulgaris]|nr:hypothetical protein DFH09DRAFT_503484 [Mycena vulgaris]